MIAEGARTVAKIFIATHRGDLRLTRICLASVRYWYPEIPIYLLVDELHGPADTSELESVWAVQRYDMPRREFGWGLSKLMPHLCETSGRFLVLDSDTVLAGRVLDLIRECPDDFVVDAEVQSPRRLGEIYFLLEGVAAFDPAFRYPGFTFNTGQVVAEAGRLSWDDFDPLVDWSSHPPRLRRPDVFKNGEQGILNYVVMKKAARGELTIGRVPLMLWSEATMRELSVKRLASKEGYPSIIHWAGLKRRTLGAMPRSDILRFFERCYYERIPFGEAVRRWRTIEIPAESLRRTARRLRIVARWLGEA